jgi:ribosomal protein S18 acetylase RimI-like enzyme
VTSAPQLDVRLEVWDTGTALARVDELVSVYRSAFLDRWEPDPHQAARDRRLHVGRHLRRGDATVLVASDADGLTGFTYSVPGRPGNWWHDTVRSGLSATQRLRWLADCTEIVELHVAPRAQGQGLGRALLRGALARSSARTAVLSALDDPDLPARHLYQSEGFILLCSSFFFPGTSHSYAILGRDLQ